MRASQGENGDEWRIINGEASVSFVRAALSLCMISTREPLDIPTALRYRCLRQGYHPRLPSLWNNHDKAFKRVWVKRCLCSRQNKQQTS